MIKFIIPSGLSTNVGLWRKYDNMIIAVMYKNSLRFRFMSCPISDDSCMSCIYKSLFVLFFYFSLIYPLSCGGCTPKSYIPETVQKGSIPIRVNMQIWGAIECLINRVKTRLYSRSSHKIYNGLLTSLVRNSVNTNSFYV